MSHKISVVVDDEPSVRNFIVTVLQSDGFETIEAQNGVQALELIRNLGTGVALLVSDIRMEKMDGITLACSVRLSSPPFPSYSFLATLKSNKRKSLMMATSSLRSRFTPPRF